MRISWPFFVFLGLAAVAAPPKVIDQILVKTSATNITLRAVQLDDIISQIQHQVAKPVVIGLAEAKMKVSEVVLDLLCQREAKEFEVIKRSVTADQVKEIRSVLDSRPETKALKFLDSEIEDAFNRGEQGRDFLDLKGHQMEVYVSENEVQDYYVKNHAQFGESTLEQVKKTIHDNLVKQQTDEKLRQYFEVLKRKYKVSFQVSTQ